MEVEVNNIVGVPEGHLLSIRAGSTRRQAPVPLTEPLRFPNLPFNAKHFKIDVLKTVGTARLDINAQKESEAYNFAIDMGNQVQAQVGLTVRGEPKLCGKRAADLKQYDETIRSEAATATDRTKAARETRDYAMEHNIPNLIQEMLQNVLRERPKAPYSIMADFLRRCATERGEISQQAAGSNSEQAAAAPAAPAAASGTSAQGAASQPAATAPKVTAAGAAPAAATSDTPLLEAVLKAQQMSEEDLERLRLEAEHMALQHERAQLLQEAQAESEEDLERLHLEADHLALQHERATLLLELAAME